MKQIILSSIIRNRVNLNLWQTKRLISDYMWRKIVVQRDEVPQTPDLRKAYARLKIAVEENGKKGEKAVVENAVSAAKKSRLSAYFIAKALELSALEDQKICLSLLGPDRMVIILHVVTTKFDTFKHSLVNVLKAQLQNVQLNKLTFNLQKIFDEVYIVLCKKNCSLDEATETALNIGADDVEEIEWDNEKYFLFTVSPPRGLKCQLSLINKDYEIYFSGITHQAKQPVAMDSDAKKTLDTLETIISNMPEVKLMEHNLQ